MVSVLNLKRGGRVEGHMVYYGGGRGEGRVRGRSEHTYGQMRGGKGHMIWSVY